MIGGRKRNRDLSFKLLGVACATGEKGTIHLGVRSPENFEPRKGETLPGTVSLIPSPGLPVQLRSVLCCRLLPFALVSPFSPVARVSLIRLRSHVTAHTPGVACVGLSVVVYEASAEVYEPGVGGIFGTRRCRPITGRLDVGKGMA